MKSLSFSGLACLAHHIYIYMYSFFLQAHLYQLIGAADITFISVGHRRTLYKHHKRFLHISKIDPDCNSRSQNWHIEPINQDTSNSMQKP